MRVRSVLLLGIGLSILTTVLLLIGYANSPRQRFTQPTTLSWQRIPSHRWQTTDSVVTLRFAPEEIGPLTLHTVVDAGADTRELWYLPWIHDHPSTDPLLIAYVDELADALVHFGAQVDLVGVEGERWEWDLRNHDVSPYAHEVISPPMADDVREIKEALEEEQELEYLLSPSLRSMGREWERTSVARAEQALLTSTTTPVIGVEDPELVDRMIDQYEYGTSDPILSRDRSNTAVVVLLTELRARHGRRALLVFGMAHYAEIEEKVRRLGDVTLRVTCIPALCGTNQRAP